MNEGNPGAESESGSSEQSAAGVSGGKGRLVIISGPSGSGKSTVVRRLLARSKLPLRLSVSATTRAPRPGEVDGKDYHFLAPEEFQRRRVAGEFLEFKEVFGLGCWYGTLRDQVASGLDAGQWVILEIDVQGALTILDHDELDPITLFIHPGSMRELEQRLRARGTETEEAIQARLKAAAGEMGHRARYQHEIINRKIDTSVETICQLLGDSLES